MNGDTSKPNTHIKDFINKTSGLKLVEHLDFIRYLRILKDIM